MTGLFAACTADAPAPKSSTPSPGDYVRTQTNPEKNAYFGDLHVHTGNSFDAFIFNVKATPDEAYRFAKGETIKHPGQFKITLDGPPLDFYAVTDHGEYLGILRAMKDRTSPLSKTDIARDMSFLNVEKLQAAFARVSASTRSGVPLLEINDQAHMNSVWQATVAVADAHYIPGRFTTFSGYEFSSVRARNPNYQSVGGNLHRNVIFENAAPKQLFTTLDSPNPEDLWTWMDGLRADGLDSLAIPHNSNVSDGHMFSTQTYDGQPMTADYAAERMRNEPLVEITQVKGTSETHPALAPHDEWADFEIYEDLLNTTMKGKISGSYIREALASGTELEGREGYNPFRFGFIGSSDTHVAGSGFTERKHWGKMGFVDGRPKQRGSVPPKGAKSWDDVPTDKPERPFGKWSASGLAGVWAEENTRESLFAAMRRKETFATSGPRISVRLFAGPAFDEGILSDPDMVKTAYATGVPMGGSLNMGEPVNIGARPPAFLAWATKDPRSAPLDRMQIIKVWSENGELKERISDIACSKGIVDSVTQRCPDNGAFVDLETCHISENAGSAELKTVWTDPAYNPQIPTAYYIRVLENPTCRWSTWDAINAGVPPNPNFPKTLQERAWSSPIWVGGN